MIGAAFVAGHAFLSGCLAVLLTDGNKYIFDDDCPAPHPCTCNLLQINCRNLSLTEVPPLNKPSKKTKHYFWQVDVSFNNIRSIRSRAFQNLTVYQLYMSNNSISTMAPDSLEGSEHSLRGIGMENNNFTELPIALGSLRKLNTLRLHYNPLSSVGEGILKNLSGSLTALDIGFESMDSWPMEINVLHKLSLLTIHGLPKDDLPDDAFKGLRNSLSILQFQGTKLKEIPNGIKVLTSLSSLTLDDNIHLTDEGIHAHSFDGMTSLNDVYIRNSSFTQVPDFSSLINLQYLTVSFTNITEWNRNRLPKETKLSTIDLDSTEFTEIPKVISSIPSLASVSLMDTKISVITDSDFAGLSNLESLGLANCPIKNISMNAFKDNKLMVDLDLSNTKLTTIPRAVEHLSDLRGVYLNGDDIQCTCASLDWVKHWNHTRPAWGVTGDCKNLNNTSIMTFINKYIPKCPV